MGGTAYAGRIRVLGATLRKKNERKRARMTILRQGSTSAISSLNSDGEQVYLGTFPSESHGDHCHAKTWMCMSAKCVVLSAVC